MDNKVNIWLKYITIITFVIISACSEENIEKSQLEKEYDNLRSIKLIDTFSNELRLVPNYITTADFFPMYIGKQMDSIFLAYILQSKNSVSTETYKSPDSLDLIIFVDTSNIVGSAYNFNTPPPPPPPPSYTEEEYIEWKSTIERSKLSRGCFMSYSVIIKNIGNDTLTMGGEFDELPVNIEIKDSVGEWNRISRGRWRCIPPSTFYNLAPSEILITNCILFEGSYYTKMRLVFGIRQKIYSNEFHGTIDYRLFEEIKQSTPKY